MANILIRRKTGSSSYETLYPSTTIGQVSGLQTALDGKVDDTQVGANDGVASLDSTGKVPIAQLPDAVFDSLLFFGTIIPGTTEGLIQAQATVIAAMIAAANSADRSPVGYYLVASSAGAVEPFAGQITIGEPETAKYVTLTLQGGDNGSTSTTTTGTMEIGDWMVITAFSGLGTSASPYVVSATVVNNVYEVATSSVHGIARLSDATNAQAYNASTNTGGLVNGSTDVITENFLFDNIVADGTDLYNNNEPITGKFAPSSHTHSQYQPVDAGLTSISGLTTAADKMIYTTASDTYAVTTLTSFARTLLDDATAAVARSTLGVDSSGEVDDKISDAIAEKPDIYYDLTKAQADAITIPVGSYIIDDLATAWE